MRRNWRQVYIILALLVDSAFIWCSAILSYYVRRKFGDAPRLTQQSFYDTVVMCWAMFMIYASVLGLYRAAYHVPTREQHSIGIRAYLFTIPTFFSFLFLFNWGGFPRGFTIIFFMMMPLGFLIGRAILAELNSLLQRAGFGTFNALIIGYNGVSEKILQTYNQIPQLGCRVQGIIEKVDEAPSRKNGAGGSSPRYRPEDLLRVIVEKRIDRILVPSLDDAAKMPDLLEICRTRNIELKILSPEFDGMFRFQRIHDVAGIPLYSRKRRATERMKSMTKRAFDIVGALIGILITAPITIAAAIAILIEDGRPVFFKQKRALAEGKPEIEVLKFRSMKKDAEMEQEELYKVNKRTGGLFFIEDDPRVTRVGRILRKFSIDEIPQFLKVLTGEMSLVGPRPLSMADLKNISPDNRMSGYYELRSNAKPGVTGLWQISGRREVSFKEMVLLDLYYIENKSIMFDIEILFATLYVVLMGKGAY